jgi:hypothetical protein
LSSLNSGWAEICWGWANYNSHKKLGLKKLLGQKTNINLNSLENHIICHWAKIGPYLNGLSHQMLLLRPFCHVIHYHIRLADVATSDEDE